MSRRDSKLYIFLMDALMSIKYPLCLYWVSRSEGIFCLECLCKSKRNWTPLRSKIFDDWHNLKPRKSTDKRQRFLAAMRACPFIEPLEDRSTKELKYYKFKAHGTSSVHRTDENAALAASSEDVEMSEIPAVSTAENGPPTGDTSMEDNVCDLPTENDFDSCLSPMLADCDSSLQGPMDMFEIDEETRNDIDLLLERVSSSVPELTANEQDLLDIGASTSLYDDSRDLVRSSSSCCQATDPSDHCDLQGDESSYQFEAIEENGDVPADYDPAMDLIASIGALKPPETAADLHTEAVPEADPNQLGNVPAMTSTSGESSKCQSVRVFKLNDNDGIVRSLRGDNHEQKFYMMVLKPVNM